MRSSFQLGMLYIPKFASLFWRSNFSDRIVMADQVISLWNADGQISCHLQFTPHDLSRTSTQLSNLHHSLPLCMLNTHHISLRFRETTLTSIRFLLSPKHRTVLPVHRWLLNLLPTSSRRIISG